MADTTIGFPMADLNCGTMRAHMMMVAVTPPASPSASTLELMRAVQGGASDTLEAPTPSIDGAISGGPGTPPGYRSDDDGSEQKYNWDLEGCERKLEGVATMHVSREVERCDQDIFRLVIQTSPLLSHHSLIHNSGSRGCSERTH